MDLLVPVSVIILEGCHSAKSPRQKIGTIDKLREPNETLQTILFSWKQHSGRLTWII